jgi:hypothetical protein
MITQCGCRGGRVHVAPRGEVSRLDSIGHREQGHLLLQRIGRAHYRVRPDVHARARGVGVLDCGAAVHDDDATHLLRQADQVRLISITLVEQKVAAVDSKRSHDCTAASSSRRAARRPLLLR